MNRPVCSRCPVLSTEENIKQAAKEVSTWSKWKINNIKNVFTEPEIRVPNKDIKLKNSDNGVK